MKAYDSFDAYAKAQSTRNRAIIRPLRAFVKRVAPLRESVKWGNGVWVTVDANIAFVHAAEDHVQFGFFYGATLDDPGGLLEGSGKYVRHVKLRKPAEIDEAALGALLRQAATK